MSSYSVHSEDFGPRHAGAPTFATETPTRQELPCNGSLVDADVRGESGKARLVYSIGWSPPLVEGE